jgi:hypothetical protein
MGGGNLGSNRECHKLVTQRRWLKGNATMTSNGVLSAYKWRLGAALIVGLVSANTFASEGGLSPTRAQEPNCGLSQADAAGLSADPGTDVHAIDEYSDTIYRLFKARRFKQIDCIANYDRAQKAKFSGGMWKIHAVYPQLSRPPLHATSEDWVAEFKLLNEWVARRPGSITAKVALADAYVNYGWDARGPGFSDTVSDSGWKIFRSRSAKAEQILQQAAKPSINDPEWYLTMQSVAQAQGWDPEANKKLFDQAVQFEPTYYYYYRMYSDSILPKWGGEPGELARFLQETADTIGGDAGDSIYFRVAGYEVCGCQTDRNLNLSWARIQKGFAAIDRETGSSLDNYNIMAHLAISFDDGVTANKMFVKIGNQWSKTVWRDSSNFDSMKEWAEQVEAMAAKNRPAEEAASANLRTDEGQKYNALFADKINSWMQPCIAEVKEKDLGYFKLLVKVGRDGTVDDIRVNGTSMIMRCLLPKMSEYRQTKQAVLPAPPQQDYWARLDYNHDASDSAALRK